MGSINQINFKGTVYDICGDEFNSLNRDLYGTDNVSFTYTSEKYIKTNGNIVSDSHFSYSDPVRVYEGDAVTFTARGYSDVIAMISTCDSEGGNILPVVASIDSTVRSYQYSVVADGYIAVSYNHSYQHDLEIDRASNIADNVEKLDNDMYITSTPVYTATTGKYVNTSGGFSSSANFAYTSAIAVSKNDIVKVTARGYQSSVAMISTCDSEGGNITPVVLSQNNVYSYSYTATMDGYVILSYSVNYTFAVTISRNALNYLQGQIDTTKASPIVSLSLFEKFGIVGDSFASGELYWDDTHEDKYTVSWGQILARRLGTTCTNYSRGGFTTRSFLTDTSKGLPVLLSNTAENIYYLALGINDYYNLGIDYLGTIADITNYESYTDYADTFYGNYGRIIEQIESYAPNAKIVMFTIATTGDVPTAFNNAIIAIANHYSIPYVVQFDDPFFTSFIYQNRVSGHPRAVAYSGMAMAFERLIADCIVNNFDYFADYYMY